MVWVVCVCATFVFAPIMELVDALPDMPCICFLIICYNVLYILLGARAGMKRHLDKKKLGTYAEKIKLTNILIFSNKFITVQNLEIHQVSLQSFFNGLKPCVKSTHIAPNKRYILLSLSQMDPSYMSVSLWTIKHCKMCPLFSCG